MNRTPDRPQLDSDFDHAARWIEPTAVLDRIRREVRRPKGWNIRQLIVQRVFPSKPIGFGVQYQLVVHHARHGTAKGSVYLSPLVQPVPRPMPNLKIDPHGVFTLAGFAVPVESGRMLLHTADRDPQLPDLRAAASPLTMSRRLKLGYRPRCRCLSYRPGKRCTLAYVDRRESNRFVVGKVFNNGLFDSVPALHRRVRAALKKATTDSFEVPRVLRSLADLRMVVFTGVPVMYGTCRADLAVAAGRVLAGLHEIRNVTHRPFLIADETKAVERWIMLVDRLDRLDSRTRRLHTWISRAGRRLPPGPRVLLHRDFYEAQLVSTRRGWALVDLDTAGVGDRELDVANYVAHQIWNGIRTRSPRKAGRDAATFIRSYLSHRHGKFQRLNGRRLRFYLVSSLVRVALIHSLRTGEQVAANTLLRVADRWSHYPAQKCLPQLANLREE